MPGWTQKRLVAEDSRSGYYLEIGVRGLVIGIQNNKGVRTYFLPFDFVYKICSDAFFISDAYI